MGATWSASWTQKYLVNSVCTFFFIYIYIVLSIEWIQRAQVLYLSLFCCISKLKVFKSLRTRFERLCDLTPKLDLSHKTRFILFNIYINTYRVIYTHLVAYAFQGLGWLSNQHVHTRRKQHKPVVVLIFLIFFGVFFILLCLLLLPFLSSPSPRQQPTDPAHTIDVGRYTCEQHPHILIRYFNIFCFPSQVSPPVLLDARVIFFVSHLHQTRHQQHTY